MLFLLLSGYLGPALFSFLFGLKRDHFFKRNIHFFVHFYDRSAPHFSDENALQSPRSFWLRNHYPEVVTSRGEVFRCTWQLSAIGCIQTTNLIRFPTKCTWTTLGASEWHQTGGVTNRSFYDDMFFSWKLLSGPWRQPFSSERATNKTSRLKMDSLFPENGWTLGTNFTFLLVGQK